MRSSLAPAVTEIASVPNAVALPAFKVPTLTVVPPLYVLAPDSMSVTAPTLDTAPVPLMTFEKFNDASLRLNVRVALFVTLLAILPLVDPDPISRVPALMVVSPV